MEHLRSNHHFSARQQGSKEAMPQGLVYREVKYLQVLSSKIIDNSSFTDAKFSLNTFRLY